MSQVTGKVTAIDERSTDYGTMYNVKVNGKSYGHGKAEPKFEVGDYISFDVEKRGRFENMVSRSIRVLDEPPASAPAPQPSYGGGGKRQWNAGNDDKKQEAISKQAARNTAIEFMNLLASQDALPVGKTAKPEAKYTALRGILERLTEEFYLYSQGKAAKPEAGESDDDGDEDEGPSAGDHWGG